MPRKLKVFQAQIGFYDTVVAAASQAAALRAWGTHQNLFADGQAKVTADEAATNAALAQPGKVLRRPLGSNAPFALDPVGAPDIPTGSPRKREPEPARKKAEAKPPPPPDRSKLDAAEVALRKVDARRKQQEAALRRQQEALDAKRLEARATYAEARTAATAAVVSARAAYRNAGGED